MPLSTSASEPVSRARTSQGDSLIEQGKALRETGAKPGDLRLLGRVVGGEGGESFCFNRQIVDRAEVGLEIHGIAREEIAAVAGLRVE